MSYTIASNNNFSIQRFVPVGAVEQELKRNPISKVFREILITVNSSHAMVELNSVTREAAGGGYRNGNSNSVIRKIQIADFMNSTDCDFVSNAFVSEPHSVVTKILAIRNTLIAQQVHMNQLLTEIDSI